MLPSKMVMEDLIVTQLKLVSSIRIIPNESVQHALGQLGMAVLAVGDALQEQRIGELASAQRIIWCAYQPQGEEWSVMVHVRNVADGKMLDEPLMPANDVMRSETASPR